MTLTSAHDWKSAGMMSRRSMAQPSVGTSSISKQNENLDYKWRIAALPEYINTAFRKVKMVMVYYDF
jgi:hypothetical protein